MATNIGGFENFYYHEWESLTLKQFMRQVFQEGL